MTGNKSTLISTEPSHGGREGEIQESGHGFKPGNHLLHRDRERNPAMVADRQTRQGMSWNVVRPRPRRQAVGAVGKAPLSRMRRDGWREEANAKVRWRHGCADGRGRTTRATQIGNCVGGENGMLCLGATPMSCVRVSVPPARALPIARTSDAAPSLSSLLSLPKFWKIPFSQTNSPVCIVSSQHPSPSAPTSSVASVLVTNAPQIGSGGIARRREEWGRWNRSV